MRTEQKDLAMSDEFDFDFLVDEDDEIEVSIEVVPVVDASGKRRPLPIDPASIVTRKRLFEQTKSSLEKRLKEIDESDLDSYTEKIKLETMLATVNEQLSVLNDLETAKKTKLVSKWKVQDWETTCKINSASVFTNVKGEYEYSDELNRKAKVKFLLKSWNLTDKKGNPIPVSEASRVDGSIVEAFLLAYDRQMSMTKVEAKN